MRRCFCRVYPYRGLGKREPFGAGIKHSCIPLFYPVIQFRDKGKEVNSSLYGESLSKVERKKRKPVSLRRVSALKKLLIKSVSPSYQVYNERARLHRLAERSNHLN